MESSSSIESEIPHTPFNIVLYTPFPDLNNKKTYDDFVRTFFDSKSSEKTVMGLSFRYDSKAPKASWKGYKEHNQELKKFKNTHIEVFKKKLQGEGLTYGRDFIIQDLNCPIRKNNWETDDKLNKIFKDFTCANDDIIFVHSHGNKNVIGTGGFVLRPDMLAQNLVKLGLSNDNTPVIVVWSCNSGAGTDLIESYADKLQKLLECNYKDISVIGIDARICIDENAKNPVTYVKDVIEKKKKMEKKLAESEATMVYTSTKIESKARIKYEDNLFKAARKLNTAANAINKNIGVSQERKLPKTAKPTCARERANKRTRDNQESRMSREDSSKEESTNESESENLRRSKRVRRAPDRFSF